MKRYRYFVKDSNGKPYVPGSSIKGALRTALLYLEIVENKQKYAHYWDVVSKLTDGKIIKKELEKISKDLEEEIFGSISDSIFKSIRISDSQELDFYTLFVGQRNDFAIHKKRPSVMPIEYEFLNIGTCLKFDVIIDEKLNINGYFTKARIEKALCEFSKFQNALYNAFANKTDCLFLPNEINESVEPNICIGGSSGFWSKTILYALAPNYNSAVNLLRLFFSSQFDKGDKSHKHAELDKEISPHAMKVYSDSGDYIPIGWCKLKLIEKK